MSDSRGESTTTTITATLAIPPNALRFTAPPPETISQRNVEAVTGIPSRIYLGVVRAPEFPLPVTRLGKLRIVNRSAFVAWIERGVRQDGEDVLAADLSRVGLTWTPFLHLEDPLAARR